MQEKDARDMLCPYKFARESPSLHGPFCSTTKCMAWEEIFRLGDTAVSTEGYCTLIQRTED